VTTPFEHSASSSLPSSSKGAGALLVSSQPPLILAGDYFTQSNLSGCVRSAQQVPTRHTSLKHVSLSLSILSACIVYLCILLYICLMSAVWRLYVLCFLASCVAALHLFLL
jgi:hypothetical protein